MIYKFAKQCEFLPAHINDWMAWCTLSKRTIFLTDKVLKYDSIEYTLHHEHIHFILYELDNEEYGYDNICSKKEFI